VDWRDSAPFSSIFLASSFLCSQTESTPAPPPLTQTVGTPLAQQRKNEEYAALMQTELRILDLIRPQIGLSVPTPIYRNADCMAYPFLDGQPLSRRTVVALPDNIQDKLAQQVGAALYRLHTIDISNLDWDLPETRAPVHLEDWLNLQTRTKEKLFPLMQAYQREWADDLFNSVLADPDSDPYRPALIHGDLASYHILFDDRTNTITGVIDFGMAGRGDPASDIGNLISIYGESFVQRMRPTYPDLEKLLVRARFYAQQLELEWTLLGLETSETFGFTAHLGGARDIRG
jgi:aminoglycoside 2''-phosphotransferase